MSPSFTAPPPLALYLHLPWCARKCPYCDFNSHPVRDEPPWARYVDALLADLEHELPRVWGRRVGTVFLGGGTPSLLPAAELARLLDGVRARLPLAPGAEITLEANPGTVEAGRFAAFRAAGVNRLSIGVQSFDDGMLGALGRIHDAAQARAAVAAARAAGFDNVNLDLMFGLPGQDRAGALRDLDAALALAPEHLSWYQLTIEPHTAFAASPPPDLPDEDALAAMHEAGLERLAQAGYGQYEVSAFARDGHQCRHNRNYWEFGDYLGLGAGAHGKLTDAATGTVVRRRRVRHPGDYLAAAGTAAAVAGEETVAARDLVFEFMLNALRLAAGFPAALFEERTGLPLDAARPALEQARARGWLDMDGEWIRPTATGRRFLDDLTALFLPGDGPAAGPYHRRGGRRDA